MIRRQRPAIERSAPIWTGRLRASSRRVRPSLTPTVGKTIPSLRIDGLGRAFKAAVTLHATGKGELTQQDIADIQANKAELEQLFPGRSPVEAFRELIRFDPSSTCAVERRDFPVGDRPTRQLSLRPVAIGAVVEVTKRLKPLV
jgi:hypothetical protein